MSAPTVASPLQNDPSSREVVLKGIAASPGVAIGRAFLLDHGSSIRSDEPVPLHHIADEISRFHTALEAVIAELERAAILAADQSHTAVSIIETYGMIVRDPIMADQVIRRIEQGASAEAAVAQEFDVHKTAMLQARDELMRTRAQDFEVIKERIIGALRNRTLSHASGYDSIVVALSVTPQDMLLFRQTQTLGYVTEIGGIHSHTCILARDLGYPAVIGVSRVTEDVPHDAMMIVDGDAGTVIVHPEPATLARYVRKQQRAEDDRDHVSALIATPTATRDGLRITLRANVDEPVQVDAALQYGAEGIGLLRSEMILLHYGRYPTEDEQASWYSEVAQRMHPHSVTIRAFDVGGDKFRQGIPHQEENPALGLRGIRFLLYRRDLFEAQITAVLRASADRNVRLLLPMVSTLDELAVTRGLIHDAKERLRHAGVPFDENLPVGVMIETPAAAMMADSFAAAADFLSIGTNDLAQYALATDRTNEMVADLYDAFHPAVLRMLQMVMEAGRRAQKPISVCGELAGHTAATEMLIGLGITELSVAPRLLLELKQRILACSAQHCIHMVEELRTCVTTSDVYALLRRTSAHTSLPPTMSTRS